jgi:hypothetical protein
MGRTGCPTHRHKCTSGHIWLHHEHTSAPDKQAKTSIQAAKQHLLLSKFVASKGPYVSDIRGHCLRMRYDPLGSPGIPRERRAARVFQWVRPCGLGGVGGSRAMGLCFGRGRVLGVV